MVLSGLRIVCDAVRGRVGSLRGQQELAERASEECNTDLCSIYQQISRGLRYNTWSAEQSWIV